MYCILQTRFFHRTPEADDPHLMFGLADNEGFHRRDGLLDDATFHNLAPDLKTLDKQGLRDVNLSFYLILE